MGIAAQQKFRIRIDKSLDEGDRVRVGLDIISHIQKKAINENKGFKKATGRYKRFPYYSPSYAKKKRSSITNVNLINTGDMFNAMMILKEKKGSLTIGFLPGEENDKASGNRHGKYFGRPADPGKARPFLGITRTDLLTIVRNVRKERKEIDSKERLRQDI
ncbi:hypothetical protein DRQ25_11120 [Candidatus Fermentibacteria bacterium]|nr:MAG: hypothetical protein DRQ25_11120 [Candidatus Fermentibacteria bacterium]